MVGVQYGSIVANDHHSLQESHEKCQISSKLTLGFLNVSMEVLPEFQTHATEHRTV